MKAFSELAGHILANQPDSHCLRAHAETKDIRTSVPKTVKGEQRKEKLRKTAETEFLARGYEGAQVVRILDEAGGSRSLYYREYKTKEALFRDVMDGLCANILAPLNIPGGTDGDPSDVLATLASSMLEIILSDEGVRLYRLIIAEGANFPDIAETYFSAGHDTATEFLAGYLSSLAAADPEQWRIADPYISAQIFYGMVKSDLQQRSAAMKTEHSAEDRARHVELVVEIFLRGIRVS